VRVAVSETLTPGADTPLHAELATALAKTINRIRDLIDCMRSPSHSPRKKGAMSGDIKPFPDGGASSHRES